MKPNQELTGDLRVLRAMAHRLGMSVQPALPDFAGGDPVEAVMRYEAAHAELVKAVADGVLAGPQGLAPNAMRRADSAAQDAIASTGHLLAMLRRRLRPAPGAGG